MSPTCKTYPKGRVCAHDGCTKVLSIYNRGPRCNACNGDATRMQRDKTALLYHTAACAYCEIEFSARNTNARYCSKRCHDRAADQRRDRTKGEAAMPVTGRSLDPKPQATTEPSKPIATPQAATGVAETGTYRDARGALPRQPGDPRAEELIRASRDGADGPQPSDYWPACWPRGVDVIREPGTQTRQGDVIVQTFVPVEAEHADPELEVLADMLALSRPAQERIWEFICGRRYEADKINEGGR